MKTHTRRFLLTIIGIGYSIISSSTVGYAQARTSTGKPLVQVAKSARGSTLQQDGGQRAGGRRSGGQPSSGRSPVRQPQDELSKLVEECLRFLDATLARGISEAKLREELWSGGWGVSGHRDAEDLRQHVQASKERITAAAANARREGRPVPSDWNRTLAECIDAYIEAIQQLNGIESEMSDSLIIPAAALGLTPQRLRQIVETAESGDTRSFVVQEEKSKFDRTHEPLRSQLEDKLKACQTADDYWPCATPAYEAYRAGVEPPLQAFMNAVMANVSKAESGAAPAAAKYANRWIPVLKDGENYANRAAAAMKPVSSADLNLPPEFPAEQEQQIMDALALTSPEKYSGQAEQTFNFYMGLLYEKVKADISGAQSALGFAKAAGPGEVFKARCGWLGPDGKEQKCNLPPPPDIDVDTGWDQLSAALSTLKKTSVLKKQPKGNQDENPGTTIKIRKRER